jgi:hypothetical protein
MIDSGFLFASRLGGARVAVFLIAAISAATVCAAPVQPVAPVAMAPAAPTPATLPELIYWRQHLFLIPYQWGSAAEPGAALSVSLYVSKDRGATWQKISEAKPDVKAFNYRAEADGEYWFAVRTVDRMGRAWPQGPYQPELRVVVDTTLPRIDDLRARVAENGAIEIQGRAADMNLDSSSWKVESQTSPTAQWQPVALQPAAGQMPPVNVQQPGMPPVLTSMLHAYCQLPAGLQPTALRGVVSDRAGNSATYQMRIESGPNVSGPSLSAPAVSNVASTTGPNAPVASAPPPMVPSLTFPNTATPITPANSASQGWGPTLAPSQPTQVAQPTPPPASQPWPAVGDPRAPFRLSTSGTQTQDDGVTAYGSPTLATAPRQTGEPQVNREEPRVEARFAGMAKPATTSVNAPQTTTSATPQFATLEPYREAWTAQPAAPTAESQPGIASSQATTQSAAPKPTLCDVTPVGSPAVQSSPSSPPKLVGSRTFALEYDLDDAGRGVSRVELWGTRDGGQTWNRYAEDDDNHSPLVVTVDEEGVYGFRIVVETVGGTNNPPRSGDAPELWVAVDLKRPTVELTQIERGQGNQADQLILRWRATDNNLEPRPIALFYSSRPSGPWSAVATNLENTGAYAWRVERYVPGRFYLRVEARDTAGNLAAFQTREPVEFSSTNLTGRLRGVGTPSYNPNDRR